LSSFEGSKPAWRFAELYARAGVVAWLPIAEGRGLQLTLEVSGDVELLTLSQYHASMLPFVAGNSTVVALTSPELMVVAARGTSNSIECDGTWYNAWPSDDGGVLAIPYSTGLPGAPDLTGVYDFVNRRPLGRCRAHMCSAPHAVSLGNRYLASVIPDSIAQTHPMGLAAGTLVVTEIPRR
jgi:hypothetical protein